MSKNKVIIGGAILTVVVILFFSAQQFFVTAGSTVGTAQTQVNTLATNSNIALSDGSVQNAKLALVDFSYRLTPNQLKVGVPARVEVDSSTLAGCMRTVVIRDFGVRKTITPQDNVITFTPDKAGTFWITCGMGMGPGSFEVVNADGSAPTTQPLANSAPPRASSCQMGGGCGCGGGY